MTNKRLLIDFVKTAVANWAWSLIAEAPHFTHLKGVGSGVSQWYTLEPQSEDPNALLDVVKHSYVARNQSDALVAIQAAQADAAASVK